MRSETKPARVIPALAAALVLCWFQAAGAGDITYGPYRAEVLRVIDGDTLVVEAHVWPGLIQQTHVRLRGVNTAEKSGPGVSECEKAAAAKATEFTKTFVSGHQVMTLDMVSQDKYGGRVVGTISADGADLGFALVQAGLARPYSGGKRAPWCGGKEVESE